MTAGKCPSFLHSWEQNLSMQLKYSTLYRQQEYINGAWSHTDSVQNI
jgi:hypothetical protein